MVGDKDILVKKLVENSIANIEKAIDLNKEKMSFKKDIQLGKGETIFYKSASDFLLERAVPANATLKLNSTIAENRVIFGGHGGYIKSSPIPADINKGSLIATNKRIFFKGKSRSYDIPFSQIKFVIYYPDAVEIIMGGGNLTSLVFQVDRPRLFSCIIADANWGAPLTLKAFASKEYLDGVAAPLKRMMSLFEPLRAPAIKEISKKDKKLDHKLADLTEDYFDSIIELIKFETNLYKGILLKPASVYAMDFIKYLENLNELSHEAIKEAKKAEADTPKKLSKSDRELYSERIEKELGEKYNKKATILSVDLSLKTKRALEEIEKMKRELNPPKSPDESLFKRIIKFFIFPNGWVTLLFCYVLIYLVMHPPPDKTSPTLIDVVISLLSIYYILRLPYCALRYLSRKFPNSWGALTDALREQAAESARNPRNKEDERDREIQDLKWEVEDLKRKSKH